MQRFWAFVLVFIAIFYYSQNKHAPKQLVRIYAWYELLPEEVIKKFEEETKIKVVYDFVDNNDILAARIITGNSGYDLITPTAIPGFARMAKAKMLYKLDKTKLPNYKNIDPIVLDNFKAADPNLEYGIPYWFGTYGILYNETFLKDIGLDINIDSYDIFYHKDQIERISNYGVSFYEESVDVIPITLNYLGYDPDSNDPAELEAAEKLLMTIRPYIKKFTSFRAINDLLIKDLLVAQCMNHEAYRALENAKSDGISLKFIIPSNEKIMWSDTLAIPVDAPNPNAAHMFINFVLRPDIAAIITNQTLLINTVVSSQQYKHLVSPELAANKQLMIDPKKYKILKIKDHTNASIMTKIWQKFLLDK